MKLRLWVFQLCSFTWFGYSGSLPFPYEFYDQRAFCKKGHWYFAKDRIESSDKFGKYCYLNKINVLIHVDEIFLIYLGLLKFLSIMYSIYKYCTSLVKFIPKCIILFHVILNRIVFLISFFLFFNFFYFTILCWFCHTSTWIRHGHTRVPHPESPSYLPPRTIPLSHTSAPAPSILYWTWTGNSFLIW